MTLRKCGPFGRGRHPVATLRVARRSQRAALVSALVVATAVALAACGGKTDASLGSARLAGNTAMSANSGAPETAASSPASGGTFPTVNVSVPAGNSVPATGGNVPEPTVTYTSSASVSGTRVRMSSVWPPFGSSASAAGGAPTAPTTPSPIATEPPSALPPTTQPLTCPLSGLQPEAIPAGFDPVAVVRCVLVGFNPDQFQMQVATTGLGPVMTALAQPSAANNVNDVPMCLGPIVDRYPAGSQLALVGANGQVVEPLIPLTICGNPLEQVEASLTALTWTAVS